MAVSFIRSGITPKSVAIVFVVVTALYFLGFAGIEHLRHRKGPWEVTFAANSQGEPVLNIAQAHRGLANVQIIVHGEHASNPPVTVRFDRVRQPVPLGRVIYEDLTFLPGVVTFDLLGHEVELLPRALIVNRHVVSWHNGLTVDLWPTNKPASPPQPPKRR